jgi:hypothetical protein
MANLSDPIVIDGKTLVAKERRFKDALWMNGSGGQRRASLSLVLTSIAPDGKSVEIETKQYVAIASDKEA